MQIDTRIINLRLAIMIIAISFSILATYISNINEFIFLPMLVAFYYMPFRFRVSFKVIYPRFMAALFSLAIGLIIYELFLYYQLNFNILVMVLLVVSILFCFANFFCGLASLSSIIIFAYCSILHVKILESGLIVLLAIVLATLIVLFSEYIAFRVFDFNNSKLINQDEIKLLITNSWGKFNLLSTNNVEASTDEINQVLHGIEHYLEHIKELKLNCIESFSNECEIINELDNHHNRLSSIYDALSKLAYDVLSRKNHLLSNNRYDHIKQENLYN
ncbi:MAG: hypothetical protein PHC75_02640 [Burkholderiales bacterium]|nr:hypothetical protein [Burkholderiales bacterium]